MYVNLVHVWVLPEHVDHFIEATTQNHEGSVKEPGNMRFDVLQAHNEPCCFMLYEEYESADDAAAHKGTAHYQIWRDTVADWMAEPRRGVVYTRLCP